MSIQDSSPGFDVAGHSGEYDPHWGYRWFYDYHYPTKRKVIEGLILVAPIPGLGFLGGVGRSTLWLNKIRKADDPLEYATISAWRKYKTIRAVGNTVGAVSIVGYYRDQYVQDAAMRLIRGEEPESVVQWMKDEHNVPHQKAISIVLQLHEERRDFLKSGLGGYTSRTGTEARSFYDMDGLSLLKSMSTPTPGSFTIGASESRKRTPARRRSRSDSSKPRAPQGWMKRAGPYCSVHKKSHWCRFTRKR